MDVKSRFQLFISWLGVIGGWMAEQLSRVTLSHVVLSLTGLYTCLQIYVLVRDKIFRRSLR